MLNLTKPPKHLGKVGRDFWRKTLEEFDLQDFHLRLLAHAAECLDRMEASRAIIEAEGLVVQTSHGQRPHPALTVERDQKKLFAQLIRELRLDHNEEPKNPRRPEITEGR